MAKEVGDMTCALKPRCGLQSGNGSFSDTPVVGATTIHPPTDPKGVADTLKSTEVLPLLAKTMVWLLWALLVKVDPAYEPLRRS